MADDTDLRILEMVSWGGNDETAREPVLREPATLECVECGNSSTTAQGWRGFRCELPDEDDEPALAFYCPECARREFGIVPRDPR